MHSSFLIVFACVFNHLVLVLDFAISQQKHPAFLTIDVKASYFLKWIKNVGTAKVCLELADLIKNDWKSLIVVRPDLATFRSRVTLAERLLATKHKLAIRSESKYCKGASDRQTLNKKSQGFLCYLHPLS